MLLVLVLAACSGCAMWRAGKSEETGGPRLIVGGDGNQLILSWESVPGAEYTVLFTEQLQPATWRALGTYVNMLGTGDRMEVKDKAGPHRTRYYRLHVGHYEPGAID
jgi:hypothetical protein